VSAAQAVRRIAVACAILALVPAACVPATDESAPRGAVGLVTHPSAATFGEPFVTSDGWTVHVETLAIQAFFVAVPNDGKEGGFGGTYIFRASDEQQFVVPGIPAGRAKATLTLTRRLITPGDDPGLADPPALHGVEPALDARFGRAGDGDIFLDVPPGVVGLPGEADAGADSTKNGGSTNLGPSLVLVARGEKAGRTVRLDVSFDGVASAHDQFVDVKADALTNTRLLVRAEALFTREDGFLTFDDVARADLDGDGNISAAELRHFDVPSCPKCTDSEKATAAEKAFDQILSEVLYNRAGDLFVPDP
jgi:hypothetical protein